MKKLAVLLFSAAVASLSPAVVQAQQPEEYQFVQRLREYLDEQPQTQYINDSQVTNGELLNLGYSF